RVAHLPQASGAVGRGTVWQLASAGLADLRALRERLGAEESRIAAGEDRREQHAWLSAEHERLGGYRAKSRVREILAALGLRADRYGDEAEHLSSGQRQRLALAAVLSTGADVLLLDEPTTALDLEARMWLEQHLARRRGALVLVSHDRALLAACTSRTAFLQAGRLRIEDGAYDSARDRRGAMSGSRRQRARAEESRRREQLAAELARFGSRRPGAPRDGTPAQRPSARTARGRLLSADHLSLPGVLDDAAVRLDAGERIALLGPNGSGKSSLLALLAGERASHDPRS